MLPPSACVSHPHPTLADILNFQPKCPSSGKPSPKPLSCQSCDSFHSPLQAMRAGGDAFRVGEPSPVSKTRAGFVLETVGSLVTPQEHLGGGRAQGLCAAGCGEVPDVAATLPGICETADGVGRLKSAVAGAVTPESGANTANQGLPPREAPSGRTWAALRRKGGTGGSPGGAAGGGGATGLLDLNSDTVGIEL